MDTVEKSAFNSAYSQEQANQTWEELKIILVASPQFVRKRSKERVDLFYFMKLAEQALNR